MTRVASGIPTSGETLDRLGHRLRQLVRDVHERDLSGVERFRVLSVTPLRVGQVQGELALEDGDPDFTVGEGLRAQLNAGVVQAGHLVWVARSDREWHALDTVGAGAGFKPGGPPTGAAGGDLNGTYPNPGVAKLQGRAVSSTAPVGGQALVWDATSSSWKPTTLTPSAAAWTTPTVGGGWTSSGGGAGPARWMKDPLGWVQLSGSLSGGANNTSPFTMPVGARPGQTEWWPLAGGGPSAASAQMTSAGVLTIFISSSSAVGLSAIRYFAEN